MSIYKLPGSAIQSNTITTTQLITTVVTQISAGGGPRVSSLIYPGNDTAGNTVGGQTVYINGSGFETNNAIYINGNAVPSKSFISASNLSFTTPALAAGIYPVYLINTDSGATAIFVPGYISSAEPSWVTSAGSLSGSQDELTAWSYSLSATGDAPITYALAAGSSLPTGVSLAANGLISGTITSPSGNATTYTFSVVASDAQNQDSTRQFTVTTTTGEGVLFANNVLLIHADGTNNQNNHTFLDSSNNNFTITRANNATQGSFSPFSQTGWSGYFDGTGDYLSAPNHSNLDLSSGDFTVECWFYISSTPSVSRPILGRIASNVLDRTYLQYLISYTSAGSVVITPYSSTSNYDMVFASVSLNSWHHVALVRSGNSFYAYLDGNRNATTQTISGNLNTGSWLTYLGVYTEGGTSYFNNGYISNARIIKGTALYTGSTYTVPTAPLTNIANTSLLTLQSNRFIDNSNNNFAITRNGDTSIQAWSPFAPTDAYSTANVGGSGYFDGTGDWLSISAGSAGNLSSGDFTVELWFYPTSTAAQSLIQQGEADWRLVINANTVNWATAGASRIDSSGTFNLSTWNHVAIVKSGSTQTLYLNGVSQGTTTANPSNSTSAIAIGVNTASVGNVWYFVGYIANVRIVKGTAVYTAAFTPPTAPLTNIANTSLLCNFTNAGIFDQTAKNILETVGDAKVSTAQYKYGTGSMVFDGTGDYLVTSSSVNNRLGSGDFTIEMWLYPSNTSSAYRAIIASDAYAATTNGWTVYQNGTSIEMYYSSGGSTPNIFTATSALTSSVWQHFALVRSSGTLKAYVNGTQVASVSNSINFVGDKIFIGDNNAGDYFFNGYIDDLRITKGYARYTSNFTPPTAALKDK